MNRGRVKVTKILMEELEKEDKSILSIFPKGTRVIAVNPLLDDVCIECLVEGECVPKVEITEGEMVPELECYIHTDRNGNVDFSQFFLTRRF